MTENILFAVSWMLVGLIWVVQLVLYPAFHFVSEEQFPAFHRHHTTSIILIVMPLMLAELALTACQALQTMAFFEWVPLVMVAGIWACTFFVSVPLHQALSQGRNHTKINRLIRTNWIRTLLWTMKGIWITWNM